MKLKLKSHINTFGQSYAGPAATNSLMAIFILALLSIGTAFNELPDEPLAFQAMTGVAYQSLVLGTLYFILFGLGINYFAKQNSVLRFSLVSTLFFTTEMIRAIFVGYSISKINPELGINWNYRIFAGGFTGLTLFGIVSIILNNNQNYKENLGNLYATEEDLKRKTQINETDLIQLKNEIISKIKLAIDAALQASVLNSKSNSDDEKLVVQELIRVSDEVVRPLSHELFENEFQIPKFEDANKPKKVTSKRVLELATQNPFHPLPLIGIAFGLLVGNALFGTNNPARAFLALAALLSAIYLVVFLGKKLFQPLIRNSPMFIQIVFGSVIFWSLHIIMVDFKFFADSFGIVKTDRTDFYIGLLAVVLSWIIAIFYGVKESRLEVLESLEESVSKLSWVNARLGSQLWTERQHLASVVHRDVQGKLISAALKFQKELSEKNPSAKDVLNETLKSLTNDLVTNPKQISLRQSVSDLNEIWDGVFKIDFKISSDLEKIISSDLVCCAALNNFFAEFATNSVKHGKATKGEINIGPITDHTIKVTFTNNGSPFGENLKPGLGSKMSQQQTLSIVRRNLDQGGVEIETVIPVA